MRSALINGAGSQDLNHAVAVIVLCIKWLCVCSRAFTLEGTGDVLFHERRPPGFCTGGMGDAK